MHPTRTLMLTALVFMAACSPSHEHRGCSFIENPAVEDFGAGWRQEGDRLVVLAYFKSSIIGRSGYVYEQLEISLPADAATGTTIALPVAAAVAVHRKGGEGGQRSSRAVSGSIRVLERSATLLTMALDCSFADYACEGHCAAEPATYRRAGRLTAKKDYRPW